MSSVDGDVGRNVRALREAAGVSQAGLARAANMPVEELAAVEAGVRRLGAERLFQISSFLKVPVSRIVASADPPSSLGSTLGATSPANENERST